MRVLIAHNLYRSDSPSGEDDAVRADVDLLRDHGWEVETFFASSDSLRAPAQKARAAASAFTGKSPPPLITQLERFKPDVVHVHNVLPGLGTDLYGWLTERGVPVVQTLHNYRISCLAGTFVRDDRPCFSCQPAKAIPGIVHACYRQSRLQGVPAAALMRRQLRSLQSEVAAVVVLTPWMKDWIEGLGVPAARCHLRPSFANAISSDPPNSNDVLFVGRLSTGKGLRELILAWQHMPPESRLLIAGTGPLQDLVTGAASTDPRLVPLGSLAKDELADAYRRAAVVVIPSLYMEGYPRVLAEACAAARGVVVGDTPNLRRLVTEDFGLVSAVEPAELARTLRHALANQQSFSAGARKQWEQQLSPPASLERLKTIYDDARATT